MPFYATKTKNGVQIRCTSFEIIKKEIDYASKYGIDYFAFCWYPFNSFLDTARNLFLEVEQTKVKWCLIIGTNPFTTSDAKWLISQFSKENYLKIDNRPVVYLFNVNEELLEIVNFLKGECKSYEPYFIGMVWDKKQAEIMNKLFNLDAITAYCTPHKNGISYDKLSKLEKSKWKEYRSINNVVPWITTGWDKRPRYDSPVSWGKCEDFDKQFIKSPTLNEMKRALREAFMFAKENNNNLILIYAWNEFDEGGFIEPTLTSNGCINKNKLKSIKEVVEKMK